MYPYLIMLASVVPIGSLFVYLNFLHEKYKLSQNPLYNGIFDDYNKLHRPEIKMIPVGVIDE